MFASLTKFIGYKSLQRFFIAATIALCFTAVESRAADVVLLDTYRITPILNPLVHGPNYIMVKAPGFALYFETNNPVTVNSITAKIGRFSDGTGLSHPGGNVVLGIMEATGGPVPLSPALQSAVAGVPSGTFLHSTVLTPADFPFYDFNADSRVPDMAPISGLNWPLAAGAYWLVGYGDADFSGIWSGDADVNVHGPWAWTNNDVWGVVDTEGIIPVAARIAATTVGGGGGGGGGTPKPFTLSVGRSNPGTVTGTPAGTDRVLNCGNACSAKFNSGTLVTLTAIPPSGKTFASWGGACSGTSTTCSVTITKDTKVQANFNK